MHSDNGEQREARADAQMTLSSRPPLLPDNTAMSSEPPAMSPLEGEQVAVRSPRRRVSLMAALAGFVIVVTLLVLIADTGHTNAGPTAKVHPTATATATPSPTATAIPSPTAMLGFKVYTDLPDGFIIQYPSAWVPDLHSPVFRFDDGGLVNSSFELDVIVPPSDVNPPGAGNNVNDASVWVQYAIGLLPRAGGTLQQEVGPIPPRVIGGQVWQTGIARISQDTSVIRVQVYATVYNGKPFIIVLLAVDERFSDGSKQFFEPMLGSFQFLAPTPTP